MKSKCAINKKSVTSSRISKCVSYKIRRIKVLIQSKEDENNALKNINLTFSNLLHNGDGKIKNGFDNIKYVSRNSILQIKITVFNHILIIVHLRYVCSNWVNWVNHKNCKTEAWEIFSILNNSRGTWNFIYSNITKPTNILR